MRTQWDGTVHRVAGTVYVNLDRATYFYRNEEHSVTYINFDSEEHFLTVGETPEEILRKTAS